MKLDSISLKRSFWRFIWPSVIAQWIFSLYTMVDGLFVARGVSEVALSAVNIASPFVHFLFSVSLLFAVGTSTIVAMFLGQDKRKEANEAYSQNLAVLMIISLVITAAVFLNLDSVAAFLGATELTLDYVKYYIISILPFSWCFIFSYSFEVLVKTDGYPKFAAICVALAAVTNCLLDWFADESEHLKYCVNFEVDREEYKKFRQNIHNKENMKWKFNALAKLFSNYFNTLECTPQNDLSEIRQKYLILVKLYHPDFHQGKSAIEKAYAREQFEKIQIAYDNLKALYKNNT